MASAEELAKGLESAAEIGLQQEAAASKYVITHNWWMTWRGRVDEYQAYARDWDLDDPIGYGATEAAAIADLQEKIKEADAS